MRFNVFVTKNTWVFSVSRFVSTACTRFLIITLLFGFLIPKFSFNFFSHHSVSLWNLPLNLLPRSGTLLRCGHSMQSCNILCFLQREVTANIDKFFAYVCVPITRRSRKILFASSWVHSFTNSLWLVTNWSRVYPSVWKRLWNLYVIYQSRSWFYISFNPSANSCVRKKWNLPVPRPCVFHLSLRVAVW